MQKFTTIIKDIPLKKKLFLNLANETQSFDVQCDCEIDQDRTIKSIFGIWLKSKDDSSFIEEEDFLYYRIKSMIELMINDDENFILMSKDAIVQCLEVE